MIEKFGELHQKSIMIIKMMDGEQKRDSPYTVSNVIILYGWIIQIILVLYSETNYLMVFALSSSEKEFKFKDRNNLNEKKINSTCVC